MFRGLLHISRRTLQLIWLVGNIFVLLLLVASAYCGYVNPDYFAPAQALNLSFPLWIVGGVILFIFNLVIWRRLALVWIVAFIICLDPILTISPIHFSHYEKSSDADTVGVFTLMTYNALSFNDYDNPSEKNYSPTLQYLIDTDADIVSLQESGSIFLDPYSKYRSQCDTVIQRYPYRTNYKLDGQTVLSKYPMVNVTPLQQSWGGGAYLAYEIDIQNHKVLLIDVHLQSIGLNTDERVRYRDLTSDIMDSPREELSFVRQTLMSKLNEAFRMHAEQARHIVNFVDSVTPVKYTNVILTGDFNDAPGSYVYRTLCRKLNLKDAYAEVGFGPIYTYNRNRFYFHIDHILYRGDMVPLNITKGTVRSSDHYPLTVVFKWKDKTE